MSVVLHVGLPKTGTTTLQGLLARHREELRAAGVLYPLLRPGAMFEGAVEVRGSASKFGLDADALAGAWAALAGQAHRWHAETGGTTLLGHEVLAGASRAEVARAREPLDGLEVHVVVTARDLGRQATAHWQEEVKLGATLSFANLERIALRADTGRDEGPDAGGARPHFWHAQDVVDALHRWGGDGLIVPERRHLVVCPPPGAPSDLLWRRFAEAVDLDPDVLDAAGAPAANPSLAAPQVALVRAVNLRLGDRLDQATRLRLVKREWAERELTTAGGAPPRAPASLAGLLGEVTDRWTAEVLDAGWTVHGDLADLAPVTGGPGDPHPDQPPPPDADPDALAEAFVRAAGGERAPTAGRLARLLRRGSRA